MQATVKISSQGQITIPREIRDILGIKPGEYVTVDIIGKHVKANMAESGNAKSPYSA